jgi:AcrR family transcriptional regulator
VRFRSSGPRRSKRPPTTAPPAGPRFKFTIQYLWYSVPSVCYVAGMTPPDAPVAEGLEHPVPSRRPRREEVRRRLLAAASETFLERGYLDSTLEDIARRAGLSKGAVYSNFESKQEIVGLLLQQRIERMHEVAAEAIDPATAKIDGRRTSAVVMADNLIADADWIQLVLEFASRAGRDAAVRAIYTPFLRVQREDVTRAIQHALADGPQQESDYAALVGTIVVALRNGLALAHAADPEEIDAEVIERALSAVLTSLVIDRSGRRSQ